MSTVGHESIPRPADAEIITRLRKVLADLDGIIAVAPPDYRQRITWIAVTAESVIARIGEAGEPGEPARAVLPAPVPGLIHPGAGGYPASSISRCRPGWRRTRRRRT